MSDLRRGSNCPPDGEKRLMYLPPQRRGDQSRRAMLIVVGAIIGLFLVLALSAGPALISNFSTDDQTGSIDGERLRPIR